MLVFPCMSTMNISLPEELKSFIDDQVSDGGYGSTSEYLRDIIRRERERARVRELLLEGAASPPSETLWDSNYFDKLRGRARSGR